MKGNLKGYRYIHLNDEVHAPNIGVAYQIIRKRCIYLGIEPPKTMYHISSVKHSKHLFQRL